MYIFLYDFIKNYFNFTVFCFIFPYDLSTPWINRGCSCRTCHRLGSTYLKETFHTCPKSRAIKSNQPIEITFSRWSWPKNKQSRLARILNPLSHKLSFPVPTHHRQRRLKSLKMYLATAPSFTSVCVFILSTIVWFEWL